MKYVRTENGIFEVINEEILCGVHFYDVETGEHLNRIREEHIIAQADTIEELCDEIVIKRTNTSTGITWYEAYPMELYMELYNDFKMMTKDSMNVKIHYAKFGIWNDTKGLIYVAKLNNKGELELI